MERWKERKSSGVDWEFGYGDVGREWMEEGWNAGFDYEWEG
jgi:hypothetical protein